MYAPGGSGEVLVLSVGNVLTASVVPVFLGQTKVNEEQFVAMATDAHEKVVGLDVAMNKVFVVNKLDPADHLVGQHQNCFHRESSRAEIEEVFETGAEQIHDEDIVIALGAVPPNVRDPDAALEDLVQL